MQIKIPPVDWGSAAIAILAIGIIFWIASKEAFVGPVLAPTTSTVTSAAQVMSTETLNIGSAGGLVVWIPNEAHEPVGNKRMSQFNGAFLPTKAIIPTGAQVAFVSDDASHSHVITVTGMGAPTKSLAADSSSAAIVFTRPGTFQYKSSITKTGGTITVTATRAVPGKTVGAFFAPAGRGASAAGAAGVSVLSQSTFGKDECVVYSSAGDAATVAAKMTAVTKQTPYT